MPELSENTKINLKTIAWILSPVVACAYFVAGWGVGMSTRITKVETRQDYVEKAIADIHVEMDLKKRRANTYPIDTTLFLTSK